VNRVRLEAELYRLLQEAAVVLDDGDRAVLQDAVLTPTQFNLLRQLESGPDAAGHTITGLAERILCTRGNATRLVQRLADSGLVELRADRADQRLVRVVMTKLGAQRLAEAERAHARLNADRFRALSADDLATLVATLAKVRDHLTPS
jgi:DNA-binding MarR family transcriptional regulator